MQSWNAGREQLTRLIDVFDERVAVVGNLMGRTMAELKRYGAEQEELLARLRAQLARTRSLRKRDFDRIVEGLRRHRHTREQELEAALREFQEEERSIIARLRRATGREGEEAASPSSLRELGTLGRQLLALQGEKETRVGGLLRGFNMEQEELRASLERLVERASRLRVKDVRALIRGHLAWTERTGEAQRILEELEAVRRSVQERWQPVMLDPNQPAETARARAPS